MGLVAECSSCTFVWLTGIGTCRRLGLRSRRWMGWGKRKSYWGESSRTWRWGEGKKNANYLEGGGVESGQSCLLHCPASPARAYAFFSMSLGEQERETQHVGVKRQQCHMLILLYNGSVTSLDWTKPPNYFSLVWTEIHEFKLMPQTQPK